LISQILFWVKASLKCALLKSKRDLGKKKDEQIGKTAEA
jgi:hypothetical protein